MVYFTIDYTELLNASDRVKEMLREKRVWDLIPSVGLEPNASPINWQDGDTVLSLSIRAFDAYRIPRELQNFGFGTYIRSIKMIEEKVAGPSSGWTYEINGVQIPLASDSKPLQPGDSLVWKYVVPEN